VYQGYGLQGVDEKGRVSIPAALRAIVEGNTPAKDGQKDGKDSRTVIIAAHETEDCLVGYDLGYTEQLQRQMHARAAAAPDPTAPRDWNASRLNFGISEPLPFDASGRFVLQGYPRAHAQIGKFALFIGLGDVFEIWNPQTLIAAENAPKQLKSLARYLMAEKGVSL
jgi:MraZ protein